MCCYGCIWLLGYEVGNDTASARSSMDSADESTAFLDASHFVLESDAASG